jgi:hypothetical protein
MTKEHEKPEAKPAPAPVSTEGPPSEAADEDKYHGYTEAQIARIKAERNPPVAPVVIDDKAAETEEDKDDDKKHK